MKPSMYVQIFRNEAQIRRFTIRRVTPSGWEVRDEEDSRILRRSFYHDWHRVERARVAFAIEAVELRNAGWVQSA